jgi:hypothetical protein
MYVFVSECYQFFVYAIRYNTLHTYSSLCFQINIEASGSHFIWEARTQHATYNFLRHAPAQMLVLAHRCLYVEAVTALLLDINLTPTYEANQK